MLGIALGFFALSVSLPALTAGIRWGKENSNMNFTKEIWVDGLATFDGAIAANDAATFASTVAVTGALTGMRSVITVTTDTTLTAAQCKGTVVYLLATEDTGTTLTVSLPAAAPGYDVLFVDADQTAGDDLSILAASGDKINGGTASKRFEHGNNTTTIGTAHLVTADTTHWVLDGAPYVGENWHNDNS